MSTRSTRTSTSTQTSSNEPPADAPTPPAAGPVVKAGLIALMALGSVAMWLGVPLGLIYLVSKIVDTTQPTLGPYMIILFGVPIGMTLIGKGLGMLDRYYSRVTGTPEERRQLAWLKSMRGERRELSASRWKVLDVVMIWSVGTALTLMGIWFLFFAGSSLPGG